MKLLVTQSCLTFCDPMDYILSGSSVHGILQARILEWVVIPFSRGSSRPRDQTQVSTAGRFFTGWASREVQQLDIAKFPSIEIVQIWIFSSNIRKCVLPYFVVVQSLSCVWLFETPWTAARQASLSFTISQSFSNSCSLSQWYHPVTSSCHPLLLLPSIFPSIRVFSNESALCIRWLKYWTKYWPNWASLIAQLVESTFNAGDPDNSWVRKIHWRRDRLPTPVFLGFPCGSVGKESACNARDLGSIPGLGRSPGEGKGYPLQYSGLENSMDCIVRGVAKNQTQLSDFHFHFLHWAKCFSFSISPSNEYSGLISFRIDWFDLLAVRGTLKSLLQQCFNFVNLKTPFCEVANLLPNIYLQNTSGISSLPLVYITALF